MRWCAWSWATGDGRLRLAVRRRIESAAQEQQLWVSAITPWEIGMLVAKGRLVLGRDVMDWLQAALSLPGIRVAPLEPALAVASHACLESCTAIQLTV